MTTTIKPLFEMVDGEYRMTPAAMLITAAAAVGCLLPGEDATVDAGRNRAFVREMLAAARDGGFLQVDILETVLSQPLPNHRAFELAQAACDCITDAAMSGVFLRVSVELEGLDLWGP